MRCNSKDDVTNEEFKSEEIKPKIESEEEKKNNDIQNSQGDVTTKEGQLGEILTSNINSLFSNENQSNESNDNQSKKFNKCRILMTNGCTRFLSCTINKIPKLKVHKSSK